MTSNFILMFLMVLTFSFQATADGTRCARTRCIERCVYLNPQVLTDLFRDAFGRTQAPTERGRRAEQRFAACQSRCQARLPSCKKTTVSVIPLEETETAAFTSEQEGIDQTQTLAPQ